MFDPDYYQDDHDCYEGEDYSHVQPKNCIHCKSPIPLARLDALPKTNHCMGCTDAHGPVVIHDPNELCARASQSSQNGFASKD